MTGLPKVRSYAYSSSTTLLEQGTLLINTTVFSYDLEHILCPQLRPAQSLSLANDPVHKALGVRERLERQACKLMFLPTYSPDLNPIELLFAKLKARLKPISAATWDCLSSAIHDTLEQVALTDLIGWFRQAGYLVY